MDERLEEIDRLLADAITDELDLERELAFAIAALDERDPATLWWLAAVCAARAAEPNAGWILD